MSDEQDGGLNRGLAKVIEWQVATAVLAAVIIAALVPTRLRQDALSGVAVVLVAMLIGFIPLRILLSRGPEDIVAGWIAAMILRMLAALSGFVILLRAYQMHRVTVVATICGGYLLLLAVETIGMVRLMRSAFASEFDRRAKDKR